tara:strand:- start:33 stop:1085 length:1053 start_codon:yes stop_codon:yes gene_type:complete
MYVLDSLTNIVSQKQLNELRDFLKNADWNYKVPGGFVTNFPQRKVNTYGDGKYIDNNCNLKGSYWSSTFWTAKQTQNDVTLETKTEPIPKQLCHIIPTLRNYLKKLFPDNSMTKYTFNIAVCNNYTEPSMNIAGHTDDDYWYPKEIESRPMFASLTFYLDGTPVHDSFYSRFQLYIDGKWQDVKLDDNSILFMSSDIPHRVLKHKKKDIPHFKPRINITLRSTYSIKINPLLHNICVANHTRYYRSPYALVSHPSIDKYKLDDLLINYNTFCDNNNYSHLLSKQTIEHSNSKKKELIDIYKSYIEKYNFDEVYQYKSNMVIETLYNVVCYVKLKFDKNIKSNNQLDACLV